MKGLTAKDHTFVICAYKENCYLENLIMSLEAQTVQGSIVAVTSPPNTYIKGVCASHNIPLLVNTGESSIARDWNFGYDSAQTRLVTIAHQDDVYEPNYLERILAALNAANAPVGVVHTGYYELRNDEKTENNRLLRVKRLMNCAFKRPMASNSIRAKRRSLSCGCFICCPSVTFARDVVGPSVFDVKYANSCDWRTWLNLASRNVRFLYISEMLMGHRIYAESTTTANIESSVRSAEDLEILESLWPRPVARILFSRYSTSEKSNG